MKVRWRTALGLAALVTLPLLLPVRSPLSAQRRRDPLNALEIDQLRDAMLDPDERLKLYVKFSRDRMTKLEQMRSDPKTKERARQTHDMLEDTHKILAYVLLALVVVHLVAALRHHFVKHDTVLRRMWFGS